MRLFALAFIVSAILTTASACAQDSAPLTGGSAPDKGPGWARFQESPAHALIVARAREKAAHMDAISRHYDWIGYDYAHPPVNAIMTTYSTPVQRTRRFVSGPGYFFENRIYGY